MSVIEKLDELIETFRTFAPPAHKAAATADFLRDHGPAIRQAMIDAERYQFIRTKFDPSTADDDLFYLTGEAFDAEIDAAQLASDSEGGE